ncbi:hypothetical protein HC928_08670 [bacterium]|nr:hypothetical protein [bacterium]
MEPPPGGAVIPGETLVRLTRAVPISIQNAFIQSNDLTLRNARVDITLPAGTVLPVALDMEVGLETTIPVSLDVRAIIPLSQTQLHDPFENLRLLFEPFARGLQALPNDFPGAVRYAGSVVTGDNENLLYVETDYVLRPWPGFSRTAGLNYDLYDVAFPLPNVPVETGIVPVGGIPGLDSQLRPDVHDAGGPAAINQAAYERMVELGIAPFYFDGSFSEVIIAGSPGADANSPGQPPPVVTPDPSEDMGILPPG